MCHNYCRQLIEFIVCRPPKRVDSKEEKRKKRQSHRDSESDKMSQADESGQNSIEVDPSDKENHQNENIEKEKNVLHPSPAVPLSGNLCIVTFFLKSYISLFTYIFC